MAAQDPRRRVQGLRTSRMEAFSDGVLEIAVPSGSGDDLLGAQWWTSGRRTWPTS